TSTAPAATTTDSCPGSLDGCRGGDRGVWLPLIDKTDWYPHVYSTKRIPCQRRGGEGPRHRPPAPAGPGRRQGPGRAQGKPVDNFSRENHRHDWNDRQDQG